ncbi:MAG: HepT-like ribonuclease domain-containing protein [Desulfurococcaceae archaeon]
MVLIRLENALKTLKDFFSKRDDIKLAVLFGSVVKEGSSTHDIDIAVEFVDHDVGLLELGELTSSIAGLLNLNEEMVNIVDIKKANPFLLYNILKNFVVIKGVQEDIKRLRDSADTYHDAFLEVRNWVTLDPEPRIDKTVLYSRVEEVRRNVNFLREEILAKEPESLTYKDILSLERAVHRIIEAIMDLCRHLVSVYSLGLVESYGEYPKKLADAGKMPSRLAVELSKLAGLRNILVHRYLEIDVRKLHETSKRLCGEIYQHFMEWIKELDS